MRSVNTRFGNIEYDPKQLVCFPRGLIGFEHLRDFIVLPRGLTRPLFGLQSVEDGRIAFLLTSPLSYLPDYQVQPGRDELDLLQITAEDEFLVLVTVTVQRDRRITLNLAAPVIYTPKTDRGLQLVLEDSKYSSQAELRIKDKEPAQAKAAV